MLLRERQLSLRVPLEPLNAAIDPVNFHQLLLYDVDRLALAFAAVGLVASSDAPTPRGRSKWLIALELVDASLLKRDSDACACSECAPSDFFAGFL